MLKSLTLKMVFLMTLILAMNPIHAQEKSDEKSPLDLRNTMGTVLIAGLVGGVLGLSTLSFYDKPQDHIKNIFFGAGGMMLVAAVLTTADVAEKGVPAAALLEKKYENGVRLAMNPIIDLQNQGAGVAVLMNF